MCTSAFDGRWAAGHVCVCVCHRSLGRVAAGATWKPVLASAPWAARAGHTTAIDAAGAVYVIGGGGTGFGSNYNDAWVSTDGGTDCGGTRGVLCGAPAGTRGT